MEAGKGTETTARMRLTGTVLVSVMGTGAIDAAPVGEYTCLNINVRSPMQVLVTVDQTIQRWGNGLGVRITAPVAKAARFSRGLPITVEVVDGGVMLRAAGKPRLTLAQKLKAFNPDMHGGEAMATGRVGAEIF